MSSGSALDGFLPSRDPERRTRILGILNLTPDSFHDGGVDGSVSESVARAERLVDEGADGLDLGAESSRPGAEPVSEIEELRRLMPVLERIVGLGVPVSVDTVKAAVAREALGAGATIVNDVSGLTADRGMPGICATAARGVILMHLRGSPRDMQTHTHYDDVVEETIDALRARVEGAVAAGIERSRLVVDPGIGFAKTADQSLEILARLEEYRRLGLPVLVGASRKSFLKRFDGERTEDRLAGTLAVSALAVARGVSILRVHDVAENLRAVRTAEAILAAERATELC